MLKLCDESLVKPLSIIFSKPVNLKRRFLISGKKTNVVQIHRKVEKYLMENYRPVSLPPISGKIFERLIFSSLFKNIYENELLNSKQSDLFPSI